MFKGQYKKPPKPPTQPPFTLRDIPLIEISLAERVKQLILIAETADEVDALAEAYRKISSGNKN